MKHLVQRIGGVAFILSVGVCASQVAWADSRADAGWAKMTQCATITDDNARHTCTDDALRDAGLLESRESSKRKAFGLQQAAPSPLTAPAPAPAVVSAPAPVTRPTGAAGSAAATSAAGGSAPPARSIAAAASKNEKEQVEVTLAKVVEGRDGKLTLVTSDGAVWHQVESGTLREVPKQGGTMTIEARSLGGFMCQSGKYVSFRCYRSK